MGNIPNAGNSSTMNDIYSTTNPNLDSNSHHNLGMVGSSSYSKLHSTGSSGSMNTTDTAGESIMESEVQNNQRILRCMAENKFTTPTECLETYFKLSIRVPPTLDFSIHEKVWLSLCRYVCMYVCTVCMCACDILWKLTTRVNSYFS